MLCIGRIEKLTASRDGAFGAIQINGPASAPYNIDVGPVLLGDWMHDTAEHVFQTQGSGTMELGLINGSTNFGMTFQRNKTHRVRLINTSMDSVYKVSVDGHKMTVIANDLVPVVPAIVDSVTLVQGQRYDVIINASESVQSYFLRATTQTDCTSVGFADVKATVRYLNEDGSTPANFGAPPTTTGLPPTTDCTDGTFEPHLKVPVGPMSVALQDVNWVQNFPDVGPIFWSIKDVAYNSPWSYPSMSAAFPETIYHVADLALFQRSNKSRRRTQPMTRASRSSACRALRRPGSTS